jgi:hypothetical protein
MIGLTAARAHRDAQRLRTQQAQYRVQWWQAQTRAAALRAATSPMALLAAGICGWWFGKRSMRGPARGEARARVNWRSIRQVWLQILPLWTLFRGLQRTLGNAPTRRDEIGTQYDQARPNASATRSGPAYRDGEMDGL